MARTRTLTSFLEVGRMIRDRMQHVLPLSLTQCELLRLVSERNGTHMRDVAQHFHITAPSATALVDEMVRGGYLSRSMSERDRRQINVALTSEGRHMLNASEVTRATVLQELLAPLTEHDRTNLNRILEKVIAAQTPRA
jgi:DNA-binding MarR family transcriptional regulator